MAGVVAIHQPNFFPWLGHFSKIGKADIFIFLDAVAYPRSGSGGMGSWVNRVRINIQSEARWVTCPVRRVALGTQIRMVEIDDTRAWRKTFLKTLETNYRKAANFSVAMATLEPLIVHPERNLAIFNIHAITRIASVLGVDAKFKRQSDLPHVGQATKLLVSLVKAVGGDSYLAGGGAAEYQNDALFAESGLTLRYQNFTPSPYGPATKFIPGLSVIDYLMHDGRPLAVAFPQG